uniref:Secreted protein n=1 Tax=Anguilla anguilla TaxID=7936 RepID=A0A0E9RDP9_ANGAN
MLLMRLPWSNTTIYLYHLFSCVLISCYRPIPDGDWGGGLRNAWRRPGKRLPGDTSDRYRKPDFQTLGISKIQ